MCACAGVVFVFVSVFIWCVCMCVPEHTNEILSKRLEPTYKLLVEQARKVNQKGVDIPTLKRVHTKRLATLEPELAEVWHTFGCKRVCMYVFRCVVDLIRSVHGFLSPMLGE